MPPQLNHNYNHRLLSLTEVIHDLLSGPSTVICELRAKQNSTSGFNSLPLCLGTGGRQENNVIKYSSVEFQILHLLVDVSHH